MIDNMLEYSASLELTSKGPCVHQLSLIRAGSTEKVSGINLIERILLRPVPDWDIDLSDNDSMAIRLPIA